MAPDDDHQRRLRQQRDLIQTQIIVWALVLAAAYFLATKLSAVLGVAYLAVMVAGFTYVLYRALRGTRDP